VSGIPEYPDPELEELIDEEFGRPPVVGDLSAGVPPTAETVRAPDASATSTTLRYVEASRPKSFPRPAPYDYHSAGRLS